MKKRILKAPVTILKRMGFASSPVLLAMKIGRKRKMKRARRIPRNEIAPEKKPSPRFFFSGIS